MVYGWNQYLKETPHKNPGLKKYLIVFVIIIIIAFIYFLVMLIYHPWIDVDVSVTNIPGDQSVDFVFSNIGLMKDKNLDLELSTHSTCEKSVPESCIQRNNNIDCKEFPPGETITFSCEAGSSEDTYEIEMRTTYQITMLEYSCDTVGCKENKSFRKGSSPAYWNYAVIYPIDLIQNLAG